ncbi:MAG: hypothetical protein IJU98_03950 [Synergistaceae bacterium]|nr:hypothetical protein [Synergistaceae bacterium]
METSLLSRVPSGGTAVDHLATAAFAWGNLKDMEARLGLVNGVWEICDGYADGDFRAVLVVYSPQTLSYGQLLELLMDWYISHPEARGREEPVIFYQTVREKRLAQATVERSALLLGALKVRMLPFKAFRREKEERS